MRRHLFFATVLAAAFSVGASAQSGTGQSGQAGQGGTMAQGSYGGEKQAKDKSPNVTLSGCVESGSQSAPGTAGTSGSTASSSSTDQFVLRDVSGNAGSTSSTATSNSSLDRVVLSGKEGDLKKHVGHKVEITGKWENGGSTGYSGTTGSSSSSGTKSASSGNIFKVSSVKMLSSSCSTH